MILTIMQFKPLVFVTIFSISLCSCLPGCSGPARNTPTAQEAAPNAHPAGGPAQNRAPSVDVQEYVLRGEVKKVEKEASEVTLRHEAISGFMEAMTMPFQVENPATLEDLHPGDQVEGKLRVERKNGEISNYQLLDLTVTKPALAGPLILDLSGKSPVLRARPKRLEKGDTVPDFTMTGQDGKPFKLSDLRGHVVVLTFIYTRCPLPDFCPLMDRKFADLAQSIATFPSRARQVRLISVSFDPEHDTPAILREHARIRGAEPPLWTFAVASHEQLTRVAGPLGLIYGPGKNEVSHNLCTAVIDQDGKLARLETGTQRNKWTTADLLKTIYSILPSL
jgi:protein SCO1/2